MFNKNTIIVVGAGASQEAKLSTGVGLRDRIASLLDIKFEHGIRRVSGDECILGALRLAVEQSDGRRGDVNPLLHAAWRIAKAMPQAASIDSFIDAHQGDKKIELCGKLAIVRSILEAEKSSLLYVDTTKGPESRLNFKQLQSTWYASLMQLLTDNCRPADLLTRLTSVAFVVFNYDRCVEHFLYHSLQNYYGISPGEAAEAVKSIIIYHPYGTVGHLPWQEGNGSVNYGAEPNSKQILELAGQIRTFTEGTDPKASEVISIRQKLLEADIVVFLGFAFHRLNMQLLTPAKKDNKRRIKPECFATAIGISEADRKIIESELGILLDSGGANLNVRNDLTCDKLFKEYWRSLSLS